MNANSFTLLSPQQKRIVKKHRTKPVEELARRCKTTEAKITAYLDYLTKCPWTKKKYKSKPKGIDTPIDMGGYFNYNALPEGYSWVM